MLPVKLGGARGSVNDGPRAAVHAAAAAVPPHDRPVMDPWTVLAVAMLVVWAVGTFALTAPGWLHLLLTLGVFLLIWRIVVRDDARAPRPPR